MSSNSEYSDDGETGDSGDYSESYGDGFTGNQLDYSEVPLGPGSLSREGIKSGKKVHFPPEPVTSTLTLPPQQKQAARGRGRPKGSRNKKSLPKGKENDGKSSFTESGEDEAFIAHQEKWAALTEKHMKELDAQRRERVKEDIKKKKYEFSEMLGMGGPGFDYGGMDALPDGEDQAERMLKMKHMTTISMTHQYFPHLARSCPRKAKFSLKTPLREMEDEINRCTNEQKQRRALDMITKLDSMLDSVTETVLVRGMGIRAQGIGQAAQDGPCDIEDELKEMAIKYRDKMDMSVEMRYFLKKFQLITAVIDYNERMYGSRSPDATTVDPTAVNMGKYEDL